MVEPVKIAIVVQGGMVQAVLTAGVEVEFTVVDYDTDGADPADLVPVPQDGGGIAEAVVWDRSRADYARQFVCDALKRFDCGPMGG